MLALKLAAFNGLRCKADRNGQHLSGSNEQKTTQIESQLYKDQVLSKNSRLTSRFSPPALPSFAPQISYSELKIHSRETVIMKKRIIGYALLPLLLATTPVMAGEDLKTILGGGAGGAAGALIGRQMGGDTGALVGAALGGAAGGGATANRGNKNEAALGGAVGAISGAALGKEVGGQNGQLIGAGVGGGAGSAVGARTGDTHKRQSVNHDRYDDRYYNDRYESKYDRKRREAERKHYRKMRKQEMKHQQRLRKQEHKRRQNWVKRHDRWDD